MLRLSQLRLSTSPRFNPAHISDLALAANKIHVLLGGNNAGKTAFCRLLAGLPGPASAKVEFDAECWDALPTRQRPVALVYQAFVNYPHWTVAQNLASPGKAAGLSQEQVQARVREVAAQLEITDLLSRLPVELSGGQQQRVAIGRALVKQARLLIMDEPLVNLDYKLRESLELEILRILRELQVTVVYTTSDPEHALGMADNLLLLDAQRIVQVGAPIDLYTAPNSKLSADLLSEPCVNPIPGSTNEYVRPEHLRLAPIADQRHRTFRLDLSGATGVETNGEQTFVRGTVAGEPWWLKLPGLHKFDVSTQAITIYVAEVDILRLPVGASRDLGHQASGAQGG